MFVHPPASFEQSSTVQSTPSWQSSGIPREQPPPIHRSLPLQAIPSSHSPSSRQGPRASGPTSVPASGIGASGGPASAPASTAGPIKPRSEQLQPPAPARNTIHQVIRTTRVITGTVPGSLAEDSRKNSRRPHGMTANRSKNGFLGG